MPKPDALVRLLLAWFARAARDLPWRHTRDPYAIWISEVMLQQTQVKTVVPYWERWMRTLPTVRDLARAHPEKVLKLWEGLGYYTRARNLQRAAKLLVTRHHGRFPEKLSDVLALPGIGRYTAGAICSIAFNQPAPIVDGNVVRVLTRVFGIGDNPRDRTTRERLWDLAGRLVGCAAGIRGRRRRTCAELNESLMELGATVCAPRDPACRVCPVRRLCVARREGRIDKLPNLDRRGPATPRRFVVLVMERRGRFFVRQRSAEGVNAGLWEFPNLELDCASPARGGAGGVEPAVRNPVPGGGNGDDVGRLAAHALGVPVADWQPLCRIKHTITRYRITVEVYRAKLARSAARAGGRGRWGSLVELKRLPFTSAHGKIVRQLGQGPVVGRHRSSRSPRITG